MKVSYSWLKEHVAIELSAKDLAEHLLRIGFEVASIERKGPSFTGVVTGQILEIGKHPNADRLSLCVVDDGSQKLSIVCGAKNIAVGQKVPVARVGAKLPGDFKIAKSKIRGVESHGMICSATELGIGGENGGIMVLDPQTPLGQDFAQRLGEADDIMDVEITPNRPDLLSHLGLARELAAYFRLPLKNRPEAKLPAESGEAVKAQVLEPAACPRYVGRVFSNLVIGPSPAWLAQKLTAIGLRPINNLVDITNYILMDLGQPLHAFDLDLLAGAGVQVRYAVSGESIKALDGKDYMLSSEILVIADEKRPCAIAGVMGGQETGVTEKTTRAFLESAYFHPPVVRKSSQRLRLRSDSSYRFERGVDLEAVGLASARAASLIHELCGQQARGSAALDLGEKSAKRAAIEISTRRVNGILGSEFPAEAVEGALKAVAAGVTKAGDSLKLTPPSWRGDLETPWDLAEEVARLLSYDKIPARMAALVSKPAELTKQQAVIARCRQRLSALGLSEAYNYDLVSDKRLSQAGLADDGGRARIANPLSEDQTTLRPALLPSLLYNARANLNHGAEAVRLFEVGKVYARKGNALQERWSLAGVLLGPVAEAFWRPARVPRADVYDAEGVVLDLLCGLPVERRAFKAGAPAGTDALFNPASSVKLQLGDVLAGSVGPLHPEIARAFELEREGVCVFELDLESLAAVEPNPRRLTPFSQFPSVRRDLSLLVDARIRYAEIEVPLRAAAGADLSELSLIDVFTGKGVPEGKKSLTLRLTFSRMDRTLTDAEVGAAMEKVLAALKTAAGAELRG